MMDGDGLASAETGAEQDLDAWMKRLFAEALRPGNIHEIAVELALRWHTVEDVKRGMRAIFWHGVFEQDRCAASADLLCWLRAIIPELPREQGRAPVRFTQQLADICWEEIDLFLHLCLPVDRRVDFVVTCAPDPGVAIGETVAASSLMRVRLSTVGARDLGVFIVPREPWYVSELGKQIRKHLGNDIEKRVTLVSEDGRVLWTEKAGIVVAAVKALLQHLRARHFRSAPSNENEFLTRRLMMSLLADDRHRI